MDSFLFTAEPSDGGERLDRFLATRLAGLSRSRIQALIKDGHIRLNGKPTKPSHEMSAGEQVSGEIPLDAPAEALPQDLPVTFLHQDDHLAVLNKASGMVVHPAEGNFDGTLVNALLHHFGALSSIGGVQRPGIVHRLDKETSGCIVVARNDSAHQSLAEQFAGREVVKEYLAVAQGRLAIPAGRIENFLGRNPHDRQKMAVLMPPEGKSAITDYTVIHTAGNASLVHCRLHTGRTHQIRVHLKHLGHPLLGDEIYGRPSKQPEVGRLMLHAWKLGFVHPATRLWMGFVAPIPPEFTPWLPPDAPLDPSPPEPKI